MEFKLGVNDEIEIEGFNNFHITQIDVVTGSDDYVETDRVECISVDDKLKLVRHYDHEEGSTLRLRNEPSAKIYIEGENGRDYCLQIGHHKGCVIVNLSEAKI